MKNKSLIILPGQESQVQREQDIELGEAYAQIQAAETALHNCRVALCAFGDWHASKKSRSSSDCDKAVLLTNLAASDIGSYLSIYGKKMK